MSSTVVWHDRKRTIFGLPLSFTKYSLTDEKLTITTGLFNTKQEEIRLYRIIDFSLLRSLEERIFRIGTIHICSADKSTPEFFVKRIKDSARIKELLSEMVESERAKKKVLSNEFMTDAHL